MKLMNLDEIQKGLDEEFLPLEPILEGFRLKEPGLESDILDKLAVRISVLFPSDFRQIISKYDFGNFTIGAIVFCATGDYVEEIVECNESVTWWGKGLKPANLIMIANSDPYAIILDVNSGEVLTIDPEFGASKAITVASSFDAFIRGIGSIFLLRNNSDNKEALAEFVKNAVGSHDKNFWSFLAN
ncbi:hypothetical protein [Photobacterium damselae]|uniref:hypothetical protein n=1 Tax=Photobacterium damselae TaxID=38293 RepID=UPI0025427217